MKIKDLTDEIEEFAPLEYQEDFDNSGFQVGNPNEEINGVLLTIDVTEEIIDEAIEKKCNLIISHHLLIFGKLKKIIGRSYVERCIIKAIKNDITIYASHTNMDKVSGGVNFRLAQMIGLKNIRTLEKEEDLLYKISTSVPLQYADKVRIKMFEAGAGTNGSSYDHCSFYHDGYSTFRANEGSHPFVGKIGKDHTEKEIKISVLATKSNIKKIISAIISEHPYEEPVYDILPLKNKFNVGLGAIGELDEELDEEDFLLKLKDILKVKYIKHTDFINKKIKRVALCGGSGSEFLNSAISQNADIYISADFKYHQFFEAEKRILIADVGHFESEQFTKDIFYDIISKNNTNFAIHYSDYKTNPINYL